MKYSIPNNKLEKLAKIIAKYQKKGANITFTVGDKVTEKGTLFVNDAIHHTSYSEPIDVECTEVFVEGTYIINGWHFVGTVEFTENGNIIRLADSSFEGKVPLKYLHTPKICEHCGKIRNRKDTYLICSDDGEWKQVGSSCLLDYTNGLDADKCADIMSCLYQVLNLTNYDYDLESFKGNGFDYTGLGLGNSDMIKALAIGLVKAHGYQRSENHFGTSQDLSNLFFHNLPAEVEEELFSDVKVASDEEVAQITEFAKDYLESANQYMRNASLAWCKKSLEFRDFGLITSFVNVYLKETARQEKIKRDAESKNNTWVGNIGDRITFTVVSARVLYYKDNSYKSYYAESTMVYELIDTEGHTYKWSTTSRVCPNDTVTATVKAHSEYNSIKQTVITRGKVISD